jgi:dihydropyrimidinase
MEEIGRARMRGQKIAGETCPQYLVLTAEDLDTEDFEGAKYVCSPPPRDKPSQDACWQGLETGVFDLFSSDHCPFRFEDSEGKKTEKGRKSFRWIPNGIPGVGTRLQILFSQGVATGRIDVNRFVELTATNHAKLYGLYPQKGTIAVGSDADIAIWDPTAKGTIRNADLQHGADYTPYEGMEITGRPVTVLLRGDVAVENGELVAEKGQGRLPPARAKQPVSVRCADSTKKAGAVGPPRLSSFINDKTNRPQMPLIAPPSMRMRLPVT